MLLLRPVKDRRLCLGMAIKFLVKDEIQYIKISEKLSAAEEGAIRLKFDQKFTQGRKQFVLDLSEADVEDKATCNNIMDLFSYMRERGAVTGVTGVKKTLWKNLTPQTGKSIPLFETEGEFKHWLTEQANKKPEENKSNDEKSIKQKALLDLIKSYEVHFIKKDYDPFLLEKNFAEFNPSTFEPFMNSLFKSIKEIEKLRKKNTELETQNVQKSLSLFSLMRTRKKPFSEEELNSKKAELQKKEGQISKEAEEVQNKIKTTTAQLESLESSHRGKIKEWEDLLLDLENQINEQKTINQKAEQDYQEKSKKEEELLNSLKKT